MPMPDRQSLSASTGNTLYISDLDGTLLRSDQRTSAYTNETINRLVGAGMCFSYATARSFHTAQKATQALKARATAVIAGNDEDGVAHWLALNWE